MSGSEVRVATTRTRGLVDFLSSRTVQQRDEALFACGRKSGRRDVLRLRVCVYVTTITTMRTRTRIRRQIDVCWEITGAAGQQL